MFVTVPLYVSNPPGATDTTGQVSVMDSSGVVVIAHVVLAVFVTITPQMLCPVTVEMLVLEQFVGAR